MSDLKNAWKNSEKKAAGKKVGQKRDSREKQDPGKSSGLKIGEFNHLMVEETSDYGLYLSADDERVLLPNKYVPDNVNIGDNLEVFVYTDSEDRLVATTLRPAGCVGDFVFLVAKDVASFGTFMDWGLEKDLLVPKNEQQDRMTPGKKYLTRICLDKRTQRVYGTTQISVNCDKNVGDLKKGQKVDLLIHTITQIGVMAVVDNQYYGMLYLNETYKDLSEGDRCTGYIMRLRKDKKIDLTLKQPGYSSVQGSAEKIIAHLKEANGFIGCHDKSTPEEIKKVFSMSKKEFKRAIGGLYKNGIIDLKKNGIQLKK